MSENALRLVRELRFAFRSLANARVPSTAVVLTLALGIGANAAMFGLLRGILLRPLVNRDESRLIYIRQTANGSNATWSVPEIQDLRSRLKTMNSFGDFSTIGFTMTGLGEPRTVRAGVVGGSYFQVMGLRPALGRLLDATDDGPKAAGAVVLTHQFWSSTLNGDRSVIGKVIRLGSTRDTRPATVVGVLEPCVPYPEQTEIIANVVTSEHHLSATMVTGRIHRMTELFARLAPSADLAAARAELNAVYKTLKQEHPEAYPDRTDFAVSAVRLRDELTSGARTILLVLMSASVLIFVIACANVANLILARTVRRENEFGIRAALGASEMELRRILLVESLLLCGAGAALGLLIANPLVALLVRYASRYSVRALEVTVDSSILWVGAGLAIFAAVLLAFVPRLPAFILPGAGLRITGTANRKLKAFALVQIAACFVLVTAAAAAVNTLLSLQMAQTAFDTQHVLSIDVPVMRDGRSPDQVVEFYLESARQVAALPGVVHVAVASSTPWRDRDSFRLEFSADGNVRPGEAPPQAEFRVVSPGFFSTLGRAVLEGRDFNDADRADSLPVALVSETLAKKMFPKGSALGHTVLLTDPVLQFSSLKLVARRIVGVVPDVDETNVLAQPVMTIYHPYDQEPRVGGGRLLVRTRMDPYALVPPVTKILRSRAPDQPVERPSTLEDLRTEVLSPDRLNAMVLGVFAGVALSIAVVGIGGLLAFSVSARVREFGVRLAVGAAPRHILLRVISEGVIITAGGLALGLACWLGLAEVAGSMVHDLRLPGVLPVTGSAVVLLGAAVAASAIPAFRAARVDVIEAMRAE